jgi:hypothetical protein
MGASESGCKLRVGKERNDIFLAVDANSCAAGDTAFAMRTWPCSLHFRLLDAGCGALPKSLDFQASTLLDKALSTNCM